MSKVAVIGGGAAGMMAAIAASACGHEVIIFERNDRLGKKLFITGKGRCNVTNACETTEFFENVISNSKFLYSSVYGFDSTMVCDFFEKENCKLKIERGQRVFPESDKSSDIIKALEKKLKANGVKILLNSYVKRIVSEDNKVKGILLNGESKLRIFDAIILATGGKSYHLTGSDGNGYKLASGLGHTVSDIRPALVPLVTNEDYPKKMQGLSLKNVNLKAFVGNKCIYDGFGEMLFTHFGLSGPLILSASSYINKKYYGHEVLLSIDLKPALSEEKLQERVLRDFENNKNKALKNVLSLLMPSKMVPVFIEMCGINGEETVNSIKKEERQLIVSKLKNMSFTSSQTRGFDEAIVTMGGVNVKEINPSTMESKIIKNLYFAGEIMDVDALTGGFNLQIAWSTGFEAGNSII